MRRVWRGDIAHVVACGPADSAAAVRHVRSERLGLVCCAADSTQHPRAGATRSPGKRKLRIPPRRCRGDLGIVCFRLLNVNRLRSLGIAAMKHSSSRLRLIVLFPSLPSRKVVHNLFRFRATRHHQEVGGSERETTLIIPSSASAQPINTGLLRQNRIARQVHELQRQ